MTTVFDDDSVAVSSKFYVTTTPALPARCVCCGNDAKGDLNFVDTTASVDYYGAIVICANCVAEIASLLGLVDIHLLNDTVKDLTQKNEENELFIGALTDKIKALEHVVRAYGASNFADLSPGSSSAASPSVEGKEPADRPVKESKPKAGKSTDGLFK